MTSGALAVPALNHSSHSGSDVLLVYRDLNRAQRLAAVLRRRDLDAGLGTFTDILADIEKNPARLIVTDWPLDEVGQVALCHFMSGARRRPVLIRRLPETDVQLYQMAEEIAEACRFWRAGGELGAQALEALIREDATREGGPARGPRPL